MINEVGFFKFLYAFQMRYPAASIRNILMISFHFLFTLLLFLFSFEEKILFNYFEFGIIFAPITSLILVAIIVFLTGIPSSFLRLIIRFRAIYKVNQIKTKYIGITGTYGKTSTKEYLAHILSAKYNVAKTPNNYNTDTGIAIAINRYLNPKTHFFIVELGAYRQGEISYASSYIPFHTLILTGLGNQHIDLYGSKEALVKEETSPVFSINNSGAKIYADFNSVIENNIDLSKLNDVTFGQSERADIQLVNVKITHTGSQADVKYLNTVFHLETSLIGKHTLQNLLPAIAVSYDLGVPKAVIEQQIKKLKPIFGKLSHHIGIHEATILNDGVNTNLNGFIAAIDAMNLFPHSKKIIITQGIIELGPEKRSSYKTIIEKLSNTKIKLFTTDSLFGNLTSSTEVLTFNDVEKMIEAVSRSSDKDTLILIEGLFAKNIIDKLLNQSNIKN